MPALSGKPGCWAWGRLRIDFNSVLEVAPQPDLRHGALQSAFDVTEGLRREGRGERRERSEQPYRLKLLVDLLSS